MKKTKLICLFALLLVSEVFPGGGSYYTRFGLGDFYNSYSARRLGLGELGIASIDPDFINSQNPASWGMINLTRFETGMIFRGNQQKSSSNSAYFGQTVFSGFQIGFPVSPSKGIGLVAGIVPYSNVSYNITQHVDSNIVDQYQLSHTGEGGVSKIFFGLSYKLPLDFSFGSSFDYYTGKIKYSTIIDFNSSSTFYSGAYYNEYYYHGIGFTLGLISGDLSNIIGFENISDFRIGLTFTNNITMNTDTVYSMLTYDGTVQNSTETVETNIPYRLGIGLSMVWDKDYHFLLDYIYKPMSQFSQNGIKSKYLRDSYKMSLGFEYRNSKPESQSFWEHVLYRAGLSFEQTQYIFNGTGINEASLYGGFSLPIRNENSVDLGFQVGKRGTTDNKLLAENIYKFCITLNIGELWFVRPER